MTWTDNIPKNGVLCKDIQGNVTSITGYDPNDEYKFVICEEYRVKTATPLTPQEWWGYAPWQDICSAKKAENIQDSELILIRRMDGSVAECKWDSSFNGWRHASLVAIYPDHENPPIAWLPLPEKK